MDCMAGGMFTRDVDLSTGPPLAERLEGGEQPRVDDVLERAEGEAFIEALLHARGVQPCAAEATNRCMWVTALPRSARSGLASGYFVRSLGGTLPAAHRSGSRRRRPTSVDEPAHGGDRGTGSLS